MKLLLSEKNISNKASDQIESFKSGKLGVFNQTKMEIAKKKQENGGPTMV